MVKSKKGATKKSTTAKNLPSLLEHPKAPYLRVDLLLKDYIWVVPHFLTPRECDQYIEWMEKAPEVEYMSQPATKWVAARMCHRASRDDTKLATQIFQRLKPLLAPLFPDRLLIACNPNIRLYKYEKGHAFGKHYDDCNDTEQGTTTHTILIYLSACEGGATQFYHDDNQETGYVPREGSLLLHLHGDDCLPHQGDMVTGGIKYVLRTDLISVEQ